MSLRYAIPNLADAGRESKAVEAWEAGLARDKVIQQVVEGWWIPSLNNQNSIGKSKAIFIWCKYDVYKYLPNRRKFPNLFFAYIDSNEKCWCLEIRLQAISWESNIIQPFGTQKGPWGLPWQSDVRFNHYHSYLVKRKYHQWKIMKCPIIIRRGVCSCKSLHCCFGNYLGMTHPGWCFKAGSFLDSAMLNGTIPSDRKIVPPNSSGSTSVPPD